LPIRAIIIRSICFFVEYNSSVVYLGLSLLIVNQKTVKNR
jgi:hypothetical protein